MTDRQTELGRGPVDLREIWEGLEESEGVDTRRVVLAQRGDAVVLGGSVGSPEEADRAAMVVEGFGVPLLNRLQVDTVLREGVEEPAAVEQVEPFDEDELLTGGPDIMAGPDAVITQDVARALEENEPLEPPDEPLFPPTPAEARRARYPGPDERSVDADEGGDVRPAAADLTAQDLHEAAGGHPLPPLDPELEASEEDSTGIEEPPTE
jgi:hypothetical protein